MTEDEAKTKACPQANSFCASKHFDRENFEPALCIGSKCAVWVPSVDMAVYRNIQAKSEEEARTKSPGPEWEFHGPNSMYTIWLIDAKPPYQYLFSRPFEDGERPGRCGLVVQS